METPIKTSLCLPTSAAAGPQMPPAQSPHSWLCSGNHCAGKSRSEIISDALRSHTEVSAQWPPCSKENHCLRKGGWSQLQSSSYLLTSSNNLRLNRNLASALRLGFGNCTGTAELGDFSLVFCQVVPAVSCLPCCSLQHFTRLSAFSPFPRHLYNVHYLINKKSRLYYFPKRIRTSLMQIPPLQEGLGIS